MSFGGENNLGFDLGVERASVTLSIPGGTVLATDPKDFTLITRSKTHLTISFEPGTKTRFGQTRGAPLSAGAPPHRLSIFFNPAPRFAIHAGDFWGGQMLGALAFEDIFFRRATVRIPNTPYATGPTVELDLTRDASWYQVSLQETVDTKLKAYILDALKGTPFATPGFNLLATSSMSDSIDAVLRRIGGNLSRSGPSLLERIGVEGAAATVQLMRPIELREDDKWCRITAGTKLRVEADLDLSLTGRDRFAIKEIRVTVGDVIGRRRPLDEVRSLEGPGLYVGKGDEVFRINHFKVLPQVQAVFDPDDLEQVRMGAGSSGYILFIGFFTFGLGLPAGSEFIREEVAAALGPAFTQGLRQLFAHVLPSLEQQMPWADFPSALRYSPRVELN